METIRKKCNYGESFQTHPLICIEIIHTVKPHDQTEGLRAGIITRYNEIESCSSIGK